MHSLYKIKGVVLPYSWGGSHFIHTLIGIPNENSQPAAEYWLGAHPKAPSRLINGETVYLNEAIEASPKHYLGNRVHQTFGTLPYLFKVLDVKQMLSIQVHPSVQSAIKGFAAENEKGIPLSATHRNYKDENHKPELMVALSDFWVLHGFKTKEKLIQIFQTVGELACLQTQFEKNGYKGLYERVMNMPQEEVNRLLSPLVEKIVPQYEAGMLPKSCEHFWAARAVKTFCHNGHYDRGIFSIYFFNLLQLKTGEAIYQPAGLPHAYLEGQNIEVMANSDNVLRAGLTDKHVDVPELMKHVSFAPTIPAIIAASTENVQVYNSPALEFELAKYTVGNATSVQAESATIFFVYEGETNVKAEGEKVSLSKGEAVLVAAGQSVAMSAVKGHAIVFGVTTPVGKK